MRLGDLCGGETERLTAAEGLMIDYIDISSVSNESKSIIGKQTLQSREAPSRAQRIIKANDILVSTVRPNLNAVAVYDGSFENLAVASTGFCVLRCKPGVNHRFVFNICKSKAFIKAMTGQATGASYPAVNEKIIRAFEVPDLDYDSQTQLTGRLDSIQLIIDLRKQQLRELDDLIKARFVEMFGDPETNPMGWEQVTLGDVCSSIVRGPFGSALKKEFFVDPDATTYKVYEQKHSIQKSATIGTYYITAEKFNELRRFECVEGDILMSCSGTMGELYQLPEGCERGIINQALCKFTLNEKILPVCFLVYMRQTIGNLETKGSGIQNIAAVSYVKAMPINLPPMDVQEAFASFVSQVDKSKAVIQSALDRAQALFDSLMQQYFG